MPRSYVDWKRAQTKWFYEQIKRVERIELPQNPIIYQRESYNDWWQRKREPYIEKFPTAMHLQFNIDKIQEYIETAADNELAKENAFLEKFSKAEVGADPNLSNIDRFNLLFQEQKLYEEMSARVKRALSLSKEDERKGKENRTYKTGMAPNFFSVFSSYFMNFLEEDGAKEFYKKVSPNDTPDQLEEKFEEVLQNVSYATVKYVVEEAGYNPDGSEKKDSRTEHYGYGNEFKPILDMMEDSTTPAKADFARAMREAIGVDKMNDLKKAIADLKTQGIKKYGFKNLVRGAVGDIRKQTAQKGGSVAEIGATTIFNQFVRGLKKEWQAEGIQVGGPTVMTDMVYLFSGNMNINLRGILDEMRATMRQGTTQDMRSVYKRLEELQQQWDKENLSEKMYSVFVSAKNYGLRAYEGESTKEYTGNIEELVPFLESMDIKIYNIRDFLWMVLNTGENAIANDRRSEVEENISNALKAAAAKIMFDDYREIGKSDSHNIHLYYLSGIYVPSSTILYEAASAVKDARARTRAKIQLPSPVKDEGPEWDKIREQSKTDADFKENLAKYWQQEIDDAKVETTWYLSFTLAIRSILKGVYKI